MINRKQSEKKTYYGQKSDVFSLETMQKSNIFKALEEKELSLEFVT
jgi:hypothetical protein